MLPHDEVRKALLGLKKITVFSHSYNEEGQQINLLFRVGDPGPQRDSLVREFWLEVVDAILAEEERLLEAGSPPWNVHICQHYLRHHGKLGYCWDMTIQANGDVKTAVSDICRLLTIMARHVTLRPRAPRVESPPTEMAAARPKETRRPGGRVMGGEVVEVPLVGVTADRNAPQAPVWTPGGGTGRRGGRSSKGAHLIGQQR